MPTTKLGSLADLESFHDLIVALINTHRKTPVTIKSLDKEAPDAIYGILLNKDKLLGVFRYFKIRPKFIKEYKLSSKYKNYYQLATVIVDPKYRGKGYGKQLMKYANKLGKKFIFDTYLSWTPAVKLYLSSGFKIIATKKDADDYLVLFSS